MARDIAADTLAVGNALTSVRIDQMILNLAKGIAWGQYELDKVGVDITKMMGVPGVVSIDGEKLSMIEAGFVPSFYHFVDTILELKLDISMREETITSFSGKTEVHGEVTTDVGAEVGMKASASATVGVPGIASATAGLEVSAKAHWNNKATSGYSRTLDAGYSQKYNQDLSASSSMRTKIVPIPPPDILVERLKILLERMRQESEVEDKAQILFVVDGEAPVEAALIFALQAAAVLEKLGHVGASVFIEGTGDTMFQSFASNQWIFTAKFDNKDPQSFLIIANTSTKKINGYAGKKKSFDEILMKKVEDRLLERVQG